MSKDDVGRNDPCSCGSGRKYKKCCLGKSGGFDRQGSFDDILAGLHQMLEGQEFASMEEAQASAGRYMSELNQAQTDDFQGLSPEQIHKMLYFPFSSPQLVTFSEHFETVPEAPVMTLFGLLKDAIGEKGLKPTATGNLPRNFCREAALRYWGEERYEEKTRYVRINKELDFQDLHVTRVVAEVAGLVRKYKGKFILSRNCRDILAGKGLAGIYPIILRAFVEKYNWGYNDGGGNPFYSAIVSFHLVSFDTVRK